MNQWPWIQYFKYLNDGWWSSFGLRLIFNQLIGRWNDSGLWENEKRVSGSISPFHWRIITRTRSQIFTYAQSPLDFLISCGTHFLTRLIYLKIQSGFANISLKTDVGDKMLLLHLQMLTFTVLVTNFPRDRSFLFISVWHHLLNFDTTIQKLIILTSRFHQFRFVRLSL